ncbi:MAG: hypothetical protein ACI9IJ_001989 [Psychromonas sp.]
MAKILNGVKTACGIFYVLITCNYSKFSLFLEVPCLRKIIIAPRPANASEPKPNKTSAWFIYYPLAKHKLTTPIVGIKTECGACNRFCVTAIFYSLSAKLDMHITPGCLKLLY